MHLSIHLMQGVRRFFQAPKKNYIFYFFMKICFCGRIKKYLDASVNQSNGLIKYFTFLSVNSQVDNFSFRYRAKNHGFVQTDHIHANCLGTSKFLRIFPIFNKPFSTYFSFYLNEFYLHFSEESLKISCFLCLL